MGFSLRFDGHVPASFVDAVCPTADEVNRRRWEATNGVGELVIKAQESKIWDCAPRPTAQRESMKFEAGQVVRVVERCGADVLNDSAMVVANVSGGTFWCADMRHPEYVNRFSGASDNHSFGLLSPAPRAGDTWTSGESVARIEADGAQLRIVSDGEPFVGDVVAVARKLWEGGYQWARTTHGKPVVKRSEYRAPAYVKLEDLKERGLSFEEACARDPIAQALVKQMQLDLEQRMREMLPTRTSADFLFGDFTVVPQADETDAQLAERVKQRMRMRHGDPSPRDAHVGRGTWPVFTPSAEVDGGLHPTRETVERLFAADKAYFEAKRRAEQHRRTAARDDLPRAGDVYQSALETIELVRCPDDTLRTRALASAVQRDQRFESRDRAENMARILRERGFVRLDHEVGRGIVARLRGDRPVADEYVALDAGKGWTVTLPAASAKDLPRAGDVYEHTDGTIVEVREGNGRLYTHVLRAAVPFPLLVEAEEPSAFAEMLHEHWYTKRDVKWRACEPQTDLVISSGTRDPFVPVGRLQEGTGSATDALSGGIRQIVREQAQKWIDRGVLQQLPQYLDCRVRCADVLSPARIDAITPQTLFDGVLPELRAGMVVRCRFPAVTHFGRVASVDDKQLSIKWLHERKPATYMKHVIAESWARDEWRIVDPDVRPLASLAHAVAAIFAPPDRATSRRHVDDALALLRGEPFVGAIRAALVGTSESTNLTPSEIAATIAALRHWEKHRPFDRDLGALRRRTGDRHRGGPWNRLQGEATDVLVRALGYRPVWDYDNLWFLYERARASR